MIEDGEKTKGGGKDREKTILADLTHLLGKKSFGQCCSQGGKFWGLGERKGNSGREKVCFIRPKERCTISMGGGDYGVHSGGGG